MVGEYRIRRDQATEAIEVLGWGGAGIELPLERAKTKRTVGGGQVRLGLL